MILSIESSLKTFKPVFFREGLNVLLSDKNEASTEKQTRNSAGKTSLVEIIHFLYGADCEKDSLFRVPELIEHTFRGRVRIGGEEFTVERGGADPAKVFLLAGGREGRYTEEARQGKRTILCFQHQLEGLSRTQPIRFAAG